MADLKVSQEVEQLVDRLCRLNLIETSQVVRILKERLNLPDMVAAAPSAASPAQSATTAAQAAPAVEAKTEFKVTLDKFDPASKAKVIREIKGLLPNLNLVEAKAFVEGAPKVIKEKVKKEEADKIKSTLEALGATIVLD
jgi:ribosomal protein L7/L12